jgi:SAM-dependent methyltransferase
VNLAEHIRGNEYLRERLNPRGGDFTYLHLADLRLALEIVRTDRAINILDYGCGGSPYRSLFPNAMYKRADYLTECFRLLKPGGSLYITTHGTYPDHACPYDFYRWTTDGLTRDLVSAGFAVSRIEKLTTGPRAALFHWDCQIDNLRTDRRTLVAHGISALKWAYVRLRPWLHKTCDEYFPCNRVVTHDLEHHSLYIVAACLAQKPE